MMTFEQFKVEVSAHLPNLKLNFEDQSTNEDFCHVADVFVDNTYLEVVHQDVPKPWIAKMIIALYNGDADDLFGYGYTLSECLGCLMAEVNRARSCYNDAMEMWT